MALQLAGLLWDPPKDILYTGVLSTKHWRRISPFCKTLSVRDWCSSVSFLNCQWHCRADTCKTELGWRQVDGDICYITQLAVQLLQLTAKCLHTLQGWFCSLLSFPGRLPFSIWVWECPSVQHSPQGGPCSQWSRGGPQGLAAHHTAFPCSIPCMAEGEQD